MSNHGSPDDLQDHVPIMSKYRAVPHLVVKVSVFCSKVGQAPDVPGNIA